MKYMQLIIALFCSALYADDITKIQKEYTLVYDGEDGQPPILYFVQACDINTEQNNEYHHPTMELKQAPKAEAPASPSTPWFSINELLSPLKLGIAGCLLGAFYYFKTKLTLYNLSKACVEQAFWSLWQLKKNQSLTQDHMQDTALLYDILQTYQTDQYALAMARFLQDVDTETEMLHQYLNEAQKSQSGIMQFALPDMSTDIAHAQARLAKLASLKQTVLAWLAHGATSL